MKIFIRILVISIFTINFINCSDSITNKKMRNNFEDFLIPLQKEKVMLYTTGLDTVYNLDVAFNSIENYRKYLILGIRKNNINFDFNEGLFLEHITLRKSDNNKNYLPDYYYAVFYHEGILFSIDIYEGRLNISKVHLNNERIIKFDNWMNKTKPFLKFNKNVLNFHFTKETFLIITKISETDSFCRIEINPLLSVKTICPKKYEYYQAHTANVLKYISDLFFYSGKGYPF